MKNLSDYLTASFIAVLTLAVFGCKVNSHKISEAEKETLIAELTDIWDLDQKYRNTATELRQINNGLRTNEEAELWAKQTALDTTNMQKVERIISKYGYPGKELVGIRLKSVCAFVILHNPGKQGKYLKMLWAESDKDNVSKEYVAILEDRIRMFNNEKQVYGTALKYDSIGVQENTGEKLTKIRLWAIEDAKNVDKRRESIGLYSLKLLCELSGIDWKAVDGYVPQPNKFDAPFLEKMKLEK